MTDAEPANHPEKDGGTREEHHFFMPREYFHDHDDPEETRGNRSEEKIDSTLIMISAGGEANMKRFPSWRSHLFSATLMKCLRLAATKKATSLNESMNPNYAKKRPYRSCRTVRREFRFHAGELVR